MNRWGLMSALALAAALLLAGCGGDYGLSDDDSADEPQITLEQIRAANDPRSLLEKHGAVTVTVQESDQNDAVTYTAKFQYTRGVEDVLVSLPVHRKQHQRQERTVERGERNDGCCAYGKRQHRGPKPEHLP